MRSTLQIFFLTFSLSCLSQEIKFLPLLLVSPSPLTSAGAFTNFYLQAPLCGFPEYNNQPVTFRLNLPFAAWDQASGSVATVSVYNSSKLDHLITTNVDSANNKTLLQEFTFPYLDSYNNLFIVITNGNAPNFVFTADLEFRGLSSPHKNSSRQVVPSEVLYVQSPPKGGDPTFTLMDQIYSDGTEYSVPTGSSRTFSMSYCAAVPVYTLTFQVTAEDDKSAFALYVCTDPSEFPCTAGSAKREYSDPRGIAVSTVLISTTTGQFSKIQVAVYGWGEHLQSNAFLLSINGRYSSYLMAIFQKF